MEDLGRVQGISSGQFYHTLGICLRNTYSQVGRTGRIGGGWRGTYVMGGRVSVPPFSLGQRYSPKCRRFGIVDAVRWGGRLTCGGSGPRETADFLTRGVPVIVGQLTMDFWSIIVDPTMGRGLFDSVPEKGVRTGTTELRVIVEDSSGFLCRRWRRCVIHPALW